MGHVIRMQNQTHADLGRLTSRALDSVVEQLDQYIVFPSNEARDSVALWVLHAHVYKAFESTPRLSVRSSEPGSGKSRVLEMVQHMTPNPVQAVTLTPGTMWRLMDKGTPTLILDECDTIFGKAGSGSAHRNLRAIINAGHRKGNTVPRCVGAEDVKQFHVFGPVAMAGIGRLPETIATRSVEIVMRKRREGDPEVRAFRLKYAADGLSIAYHACELWAQRAFMRLMLSLPDMPVADRKADVWEPLISIADLAGDQWGQRARKACIELTKEAEAKPVSMGARVLTAMHDIFEHAEGERALMVGQIMNGLEALEDAKEWEGFTSRELAKMLSEYGVSATTVRIDGTPARAYKRADVESAYTTFVAKEVK